MNSNDKILSAIQKEIKYIRTNSVWNHFLTIIRIDFESYSGQIASDRFTIWRYSSWAGVFYPVINGTIDLSNQNNPVTLKTRMNPVGILFIVIMISLFAYGSIFGVILQHDNSWTFLWKRIIAALLVGSFPLVAIIMIYSSQKKEELERIKNLYQQTQ